MASAISTKGKLLSVIDDIELIAITFLDYISSPKSQRLPGIELDLLVELLIKRDSDLKSECKVALEQGEIQKKINDLQVQVDKHDQDIHQLQKYLREAEHILASAIYQAKQKITSINETSERSVSAEELIKYAHHISASHSVSAPFNWQAGDNRRPYPTDIEMRLGSLGRLNDLPVPSDIYQGNLNESSTSHGSYNELTPGQTGTLKWQANKDIQLQMSTSNNHISNNVNSQRKDSNDIEVMSTDSSTSSSSDST